MSYTEQQAKTAADDFRPNHRLGSQSLEDLLALIERVSGTTSPSCLRSLMNSA